MEPCPHCTPAGLPECVCDDVDARLAEEARLLEEELADESDRRARREIHRLIESIRRDWD